MAERYTSPVLDRRVTLVGKRETGDRGDWNQLETEDVEIEVWASRRDVTASERVVGRSDTILSLRDTRFIIRFRADVDASWRVTHDGLAFRVEGLREINRRRYLELFCTHISGG